MRVVIGEYELLDSKYIIGIENSPIEVLLGDEEDGGSVLRFIFTFMSDVENQKERVRYRVEGNTTINVDFFNIKNYFGGGNTSLVRIGNFNNRELFYNFRIFTLEGSANSLVVNFYLGREVQHA